jgi:CspA family cold shock protein
MNGAIKTITQNRGFGFIRADDGTEYFFHRSELRGGLEFEQLREGQRVRFEAQQGEKGPRAGDIHPE